MCAQTEKTTFSCKDDCTLTNYTWHWTYSALWFFLVIEVIEVDELKEVTVSTAAQI